MLIPIQVKDNQTLNDNIIAFLLGSCTRGTMGRWLRPDKSENGPTPHSGKLLGTKYAVPGLTPGRDTT
jgi:hypothetical protein